MASSDELAVTDIDESEDDAPMTVISKKPAAASNPRLQRALSPMVRRMSQGRKRQRSEVEAPDPGPVERESDLLSPKIRAPKAPSRTEALLTVVKRTMSSIPYKAAPVVGVRLHPAVLTSVDQDGFPSMRTVIPAFVAPDLSEIRINTKIDTRKVQEIQKNKRISLHYQDQRGRGGWVTLKGDAKLSLSGKEEDSAEVLLVPDRIECVSYIEGPTSADNGEGWKPAVMVRTPGQKPGWRRTQ